MLIPLGMSAKARELNFSYELDPDIDKVCLPTRHEQMIDIFG
jgi:hypothetical protein